MIGSFRNFAKTKLAGVFVFIMIIPFVFWGMGSMFSSGNTNTVVKINQSNVSTEEFIDYLNNSGIPTDTICLLYTSPSPRDQSGSRMPSSA